MTDPVSIRAYGERDAAATLTAFIDAVTQTAVADYTPAQLQAWASPEKRDPESWHRAMSSRNSFVAVIDDEVAGFSDVSAGGFIHMMFVSPRFQRRGVATLLLAEAERLGSEAGATSLFADVSITGRPLFEHHGFQTELVQHPTVAGFTLINFRMRKKLEQAPRASGAVPQPATN